MLAFLVITRRRITSGRNADVQRHQNGRIIYENWMCRISELTCTWLRDSRRLFLIQTDVASLRQWPSWIKSPDGSKNRGFVALCLVSLYTPCDEKCFTFLFSPSFGLIIQIFYLVLSFHCRPVTESNPKWQLMLWPSDAVYFIISNEEEEEVAPDLSTYIKTPPPFFLSKFYDSIRLPFSHVFFFLFLRPFPYSEPEHFPSFSSS